MLNLKAIPDIEMIPPLVINHKCKSDSHGFGQNVCFEHILDYLSIGFHGVKKQVTLENLVVH